MPSEYEIQFVRLNEETVRYYEELERNQKWADSHKDIMDKLVQMDEAKLEKLLKGA